MRAAQIPGASKSYHYRDRLERYQLESGLHDEIPKQRCKYDTEYSLDMK